MDMASYLARRWGHMDHSKLRFREDGFCPAWRLNWTDLSLNELHPPTALTWPS
jgi:hypothetical protein